MITRLVSVLALGTVALAATPAPTATLPFSPESKLWLEGTSTVRGFSCKADKINGNVELAAGQELSGVVAGEQAVREGTLTIPVASLNCGNGTMEGHLKKALKADQNPQIAFRMTGYEAGAKGANGTAMKVQGKLTIAGTEKPITMNATATEQNGVLKLQGSQEIVMTDYGVAPPTLMMGTMKVAPKVVVKFDLALR